MAQTLAFPPWDLWPLALVALVPLVILAREAGRPRRALALGLVWGLVQGLATMHWLMVVLTDYGRLAWPLALGAFLILQTYLALYPAAWAWMLARARRAHLPWLLLGPAAWAGLEWLREWLFTGFPWLPLGNALTARPELIQSAELWGVRGVSALVVLVNLLLARAWWSRSGGRRTAALVAVLALVAGGWLWGAGRMDEVRQAAQKAPHLAVSVVQGNIPIHRLWDRGARLDIIRTQLGLSRRAAKKVERRPWLVVWSESAAPFFFLRDARPTLAVLRGAIRLRAYLLLGTVGAVKRDGRWRPTNRVWLVGPDGEPGPFYDKVHLVPFGEYVPLGRLLFFVRALAAVGQDNAPGVKGSTLPVAGWKVGPLICYESIFPGLAREQRLRGARLIVNQTNDAWFGNSGASAQHLSHLRLRAVENRLACARAANTGISGFVLPDGTTAQLTGLYVEDVRTRELPLMDRTTFFTRHGDLAGPAGLALALLGLAWGGWRKRRKGEDQHV